MVLMEGQHALSGIDDRRFAQARGIQEPVVPIITAERKLGNFSPERGWINKIVDPRIQLSCIESQLAVVNFPFFAEVDWLSDIDVSALPDQKEPFPHLSHGLHCFHKIIHKNDVGIDIGEKFTGSYSLRLLEKIIHQRSTIGIAHNRWHMPESQ